MYNATMTAQNIQGNDSSWARTIPFIGIGCLLALSPLPARAQAQDRGNDRGNADGSTSIRKLLEELVARPGGLKADDVATRAVASSFDLRGKHAEVLAAAAAVDQAAVAYYPRLSVLARYMRQSHIDPPLLGVFAVAPTVGEGPIPAGTPLFNAPVKIELPDNSTTFQATLGVPLMDYITRIPSANALARSTRDAAAWTERASRAQTDADARQVYYQWVRSRGQTVVAKQSLVQAQRHYESAKNSFSVGAASKADVLRVEAYVSSAEVFVARSLELEHVLEDQLHTILHDESASHFEIGEDLRQDLPEMTVEAPDKLLAEAHANRAELRALREGQKALHAQASVEGAGELPRVDLFGDALYANPHPRFFPPKQKFDFGWDVGVQLTWTPNDLAASRHAAQGIDRRIEANEAQQGSVRDALRTEVLRSHEGVRTADVAVRSAGRQLDSAQESYRVRLDLYKAGRSTNVEMTDTETDLTQAALALINARIDQRTARVRLQHALGRDLGEK
jgi:outer membrane protein